MSCGAALLVLAGMAGGAVAQVPRPEAETFFELKVRPMLAGTCFRCHGGAKVRGGLRVNTRAALLKGGERGRAVVPGDPNNSLLIRAVRYRHERIHMPPDKRLPAEAVAALAAGVKSGAVAPEAIRTQGPSVSAAGSWAFPPVRPV